MKNVPPIIIFRRHKIYKKKGEGFFRKIDTDAVVASYNTLVLGGIFEHHKTNVVSGIPILRELPILGYIFGRSDVLVKKRQLIIFITPEVIA